jgi:ferredoxin
MQGTAMDIVYFSPTGNVKHLAQHLAEVLKSRQTRCILHPLERTDPGTLEQDVHLVLMCPVHAFNPPRTVLRFIKDLPPGGTRSVSILSVGSSESWMNAGASLSLKRILETKGYKVQQDALLAMPLTILSAIPEQQAKTMIRKAEEKIQQIAAGLHVDQETASHVSLKSRIVSVLGRVEGFAARLFGLELRASDACTACNLCIEGCPENNIRMDHASKPAFGCRCLMCLRCVYICPEGAISPRFSKFIPLKGGYHIERYLWDE